MPVFTKSNRAILNNGTVDFESGGSQSMGGNRVRYAGEEVDANDYVIKKTLDTHLHPQYVTTPHTHPTVTDHTHPYSALGHTHTTSFTHSHAYNGYQYLPGGMLIQWGRFQAINGSLEPSGPEGSSDNWNSGTVYFPVNFSPAPYSVSISIGWNNNPAYTGSVEYLEHNVISMNYQVNSFDWVTHRFRGYLDHITEDWIYVYWQAIGTS